MTDITELAQREKFEAWWEREYKHLESSKYTDAVPHIKYGLWMAYQAGSAELVEALEKARRANGHLREQSAEWERKAISNFEECAKLSQRVEELESRTVKLPPKIERDYVDGWFSYKGGLVGGGAAEWYNKALDDVRTELTAAGIKVEAE